MEKPLILSLASCNWIRNHQNLLISGPQGVGKTFLAAPSLRKHAVKAFEHFYIRALSVLLFRSPWPERMEATEPDETSFQNRICWFWMIWGWLLSRIRNERSPGSESKTERVAHPRSLQSAPDRSLARSYREPNHRRCYHGPRLIHNAHRIQLKGGSMPKKTKTDGQ